MGLVRRITIYSSIFLLVLLVAFHSALTRGATEQSYEANLANSQNYCSAIICHDALQKPAFVDIPQEPAKVSVAAIRSDGVVRISQTANLVQNPDLFVWPTATTTITQYFSSRHPAIDISNSQKVEVYAAATGIVSFVGWKTGYGNTIILDHENGYQTLYAHLSVFNVQLGQTISQRHVIAWQGNTGWVRGITGIHLHFAILLNGKYLNPLHYISPL